jgi:hypothetical protein
MSNTAIEVVFDVEIDASGTVNVFAKAREAVTNVIWATEKLAKEVLYTDASNAHIKFQGWSGAGSDEDISGVRHNTSATAKDASGASFKLNSVINGQFDCSGATPFNAAGYSGISAYQTYSSFGRAMLGAYAHHLFGHVQATAAIDNDQAFVAAMNGQGATDAKVAARLLTALDAMDATACTKVARQVIGQDATRAMTVDNDLNSPDSYQALKFITNDVVYMRVKLLAPTVTVGGNARSDVAFLDSTNVQQGEPSSASTAVYTLRIVLA